MATRRRRSETKHALAVSAADLRLLDFRAVKVHCERFLPPEDAPKGRYDSSVKSRIGISEASKDAPAEVYVTVFVDLNGYQLKEDKDGAKVKGPKSFSISVETEFRYKTVNGKKLISADDITPEIHRDLLCQTYPITMTRIRSYAVDMGFRGVRPELGFDVGMAKFVADPPLTTSSKAATETA